jgi:hypothetical protein
VPPLKFIFLQHDNFQSQRICKHILFFATRKAIAPKNKKSFQANAPKTTFDGQILIETKHELLTRSLPKWGLTEAVFQLFVFQFGFISGRTLLI